MFILFTADNKTYFESAEEFVTELGTVDGEPVFVLENCIGMENSAECCKETHNMFHLKSATERSTLIWILDK
jgi:hypothetical protein